MRAEARRKLLLEKVQKHPNYNQIVEEVLTMSINQKVQEVLELKAQQMELETRIRSITQSPDFVMELIREHPYAVTINWSSLRRVYGMDGRRRERR
jgi:hypothetical protein